MLLKGAEITECAMYVKDSLKLLVFDLNVLKN